MTQYEQSPVDKPDPLRDVRIVDIWAVLGPVQAWTCACGQPLDPASEAVAFLDVDEDGVEVYPVAVHADCALSMAHMPNVRAWLDRLADGGGYDTLQHGRMAVIAALNYWRAGNRTGGEAITTARAADRNRERR